MKWAYLDGDESLGEAEGSGQEDGHDLTDVGGDQVADELLHVVVDGTALLNGGLKMGQLLSHNKNQLFPHARELCLVYVILITDKQTTVINKKFN